jgi:hypothetical protein
VGDQYQFRGDLQRFKVVNFLKELKEAIGKNRLRPVRRQDYQKSLISLGLTREQCEQEVLTLTSENYCKGPEHDFDYPGELWIFGKIIGGQEIYIKLKIVYVASEKFAKLISFHPADSALCYPYEIRE